MSKVYNFVMLGTNDLQKSSKFYDAVFEPLKLTKIITTDRYIGYGHSNKPNEVKFYITKPKNEEPATFGNGTMLAFLAASKEAVNKFHAIALTQGAVNEGLPGLRDDGNYYAYVRDPNGNKISATCISN